MHAPCASQARACALRVRVRCTLAVQEHDLRATTLHCKVKRRLSSHFTVPFSQPCTLQGKLHLISSHTLATLDTQQTFTQRSFYTQKPEAFAHRSFYTEKLLHTANFDTEQFSQKNLQREAFRHRPFYTQALLHTDPFTHRAFYTENLLHTDAFYTQALLHTDAFTKRPFHTQRLSHTQPFLNRSTFTRRPFYTQAL